MNLKSIAVIALAAMLVTPALAQDDSEKKAKGKKGKNARGSQAMALIKQLEPVGLTAEQTEKIKEMGKASTAAAKKMREDAGISQELMKKRTEAQKAVKESGKKGKEMTAAVNEKAGISEAQAAVFAKLNLARGKFQREVIALLTDDQKAKLPQKMQRLLKAAGGEKKEKKKKAE